MSTVLAITTGTIQPMPPLAEDQLDALRHDIELHGVLVPITVDQHGRILDGNNRAAVAAELGIECPRVVVQITDDVDAVDIALTLNCARRHLTQEQKRELIRTELVRRPKDTDRAISRRLGCSPTTVGTVRAQWRAEAEESTKLAQEALSAATTALRGALLELIMAGADPDAVLTRLAAARDACSGAADDADRTRREAGRDVAIGDPYTAAVVRQLSVHFMFSATYNDVGDVISEAKRSGVEFPFPAKLTAPQRAALLDQAFAFAGPEVSNLDTASPADSTPGWSA